MRILVIGPHKFTGDDLVVGEEYDVTPADDGTDRQNRAWHALVQEYWRSGCHSYTAKNFEHFRELIKLYLGAGTEKYYSLVGDDGSPSPIPVLGWRIKSWARYSKKERKEAIDSLVAEMEQAGVQSNKFYEILHGMEERQAEREAEQHAPEKSGKGEQAWKQ
jgi:hypothetical protein